MLHWGLGGYGFKVRGNWTSAGRHLCHPVHAQISNRIPCPDLTSAYYAHPLQRVSCHLHQSLPPSLALHLDGARYSTMNLNSTSSPIDPSMYSTPPSTPSVFKHMQQQGSSQEPAQAVLARRSSRPHMIHISKSQGPPVQIALDSPAATNLSASPNRTHPNGHASSSTTPLDPSSAAMSSEDAGAATVVPDHHGRSPGTLPKSPCFVHSLLDKGASLTDWLKSSSPGTGQDDGKAKDRDDSKRSMSQSTASLTNSPTPSESSNSLSFQTSSPTEYDEEEDGAASLTRQLAATAVGVREMSKQLGECTPLTISKAYAMPPLSSPRYAV